MTSALRAALRFSEEDLQANRLGQLSPAQSQNLQRARRRQVFIAAAAFFLFAFLATSLLYLGQRNQNQILAFAGALLILLNAILVGMMGRAVMRLNSDLRAGNIEALTGPVQRVLRRGKQGDSYLIRIAGHSLPVTRDICLSFKHQAPYRLYRSAQSRRLLSAEAIHPAPKTEPKPRQNSQINPMPVTEATPN